MMERAPAVYMLASQTRGTIYTGVTSNLAARLHQHRTKATRGFSSRYGVLRLVFMEAFDDMAGAIAREKQLKRWHREWKINLIQASNPSWRDLAIDLGFAPLQPKQPDRPSHMDAETSSA